MTVDLETRILDKLDDLGDELSTLRGDLRAFRAEQAQICLASKAQRDEHHKALYGNGTPGLRAKVQDLESKIAGLACPGTCDPSSGVASHRRSLTYGAASGGLVVALLELVKLIADKL